MTIVPRSTVALTPAGPVVAVHGEDIAVRDACVDLLPLVEKDRGLWSAQKAATIEFRQARLRLGARLQKWQRGIVCTQMWGRVLRELHLNRHTAHQAMRLAQEFCDDFGNLDPVKLAKAKAAGGGILRRTKAGQRALEAEPGQLKLKDLRRVMEAGRKNRTDASSDVDPGQHRDSGNERAAAALDTKRKPSGVDPDQHHNSDSERAAPAPQTPRGGEDIGHADPPPPLRSSGPVCEQDGTDPRPSTSPGPGGRSSVSPSSGHPAPAPASPSVTPLSGTQLVFDFEGAVRRMAQKADRVLQRVALDPDLYVGVDMGVGVDLLERFEAWMDSVGRQQIVRDG